ncbi:unnamed protein product [Danaus chrysippus]|uniref:(African queen) hypothetical protein n=1 Tax=Danaus chrysippus TaxID=151541 RepID=A0A8J2W5K4_9NEOP|nr:unnamed protein product [Danaus chrysippus]
MPHPPQSESVFVLCLGLLEPCLVYCAVNRSYMSSSPRLYISRVHLLSASVPAGSSLVTMQFVLFLFVAACVSAQSPISKSYLPPPPPSDVISFSRGASSVQELRRVQELGDRSSTVTRGDDDLQEPADPAKYKFGHSVNDVERADFGPRDDRSRGQELVMMEEERGRQVFAFLFVVASVSARGSGPYLPSGWKPDGPAFYLPTEVVKSVPSNPISDLILDLSEASGSVNLQEYGVPSVSQNVEQKPSNIPSQDLNGSEAAGSDSLSEYGPPVLPEILNQGLPDAVTEQNFYVELNLGIPEATSAVSVDQDVVKESVEQTTVANIELSADEEKEVTESENVAANAQVSVDVESLGSVVSEGNVESTELSELSEVTEHPEPSTQAPASVAQEVTDTVLESEPFVLNIPDIIGNLENGVVSQQVEVNSSLNEGNSDVAVSGSLEQAPEGFLEYGPPGFTEYGPPQGELLGNLQVVDSNAVRRRRFSPKFR